jgi:hypothetical protein
VKRGRTCFQVLSHVRPQLAHLLPVAGPFVVRPQTVHGEGEEDEDEEEVQVGGWACGSVSPHTL